MGFEVNIRFHGTVAVVPLDPPVNKEVCMLIPRYEKKDLVRDLVPYIRFPKNSLESQRQPSGAGGGLQHVELRGELLEIDADDQTMLDADFAHELETVPRKSDAESLHWLPTIDRLVKPPSSQPPPTIDPDLLDPPFKTEKVPGIAARIVLRHGKLRTGGVKAALPFVTKDSQIEKVHHVAREAILTLKVAGDSFRIASQPTDGSASNGANDMIFAPPPGSNSLELVIGNEPPEDIYATPPEMDIEAGDMAQEFSLFYLLCSQHVDDEPLPLGKNKGGSTQLCAVTVGKKG